MSRRRRHPLETISAFVAVAESLESRTLLSAVAWTGAAGTMDWNDPANWSGDATPGTNDDVTINVGGNVTIMHSSGNAEIHSLISYDSINLSGGSLTLHNSSVVYGQFNNSGMV